MPEYIWPIDGQHIITSGWWYPGGGLHRAVDLRANIGTPVKAMRAGTIIWLQYWDGKTKTGEQSYGNALMIKHTDGSRELMAHFSTFTAGIKLGVTVEQGEVIAYSGATGNVTGAHLHVEIRDSNNNRLHPLNYLTAPDGYASDAVKQNAGFFTPIAPITEEKDAEQAGSTSARYLLVLGPVSVGDKSTILKKCEELGNIKQTIIEL